MHRRFLPLLLLVAAPAAAQHPDTLLAQEAARDLVAHEVIVQARRGFSDAARATARVTDVRLAETSSVADALTRHSTAFVRPLGLTGLASVSLRGTGAAQTAVLLDGLRLTDPQLGQVDLRLLPSALFAEAALVHGLGSAYDGSDALGGTLRLETGTSGGWGGALETGSFGTLRADAHGGFSSGNVAVAAAASAESVQGDFPYPDPIAQINVRRTGADAQHASLLVRAATPRTAAGLWLAAVDRGLAPSAGTPPQGERQTDGLARLWASHTRSVRRGALRVAGYAHASRLRYVHPGLLLDETGRTQTVGGELERTWVTARGWEDEPAGESGLGVAATTATARHPSLDNAAREHTLAAFAHATRRRGRWTMAAALRQDAYLRPRRSFFPVSPRLGLRYEVGGGFSGKMSAATSFRAPTLNDRFWTGAGRPDLRPERGIHTDAGLAFRRITGVEIWQAEATLFAHALRDQIVWTPDASGRWRPENLLRTRTFGLEASGSWHLRDDFGRPTVDGSVAVTDAVDRSDPSSPTYGRQLRYVPRLVARAGAQAAPGRFGFSLDARYVGARFATADESQTLAPVLTLDIGASVQAGPLRFGLRLDNLFDTHTALLDGYPMPGRAAYVRVAWQDR